MQLITQLIEALGPSLGDTVLKLHQFSLRSKNGLLLTFNPGSIKTGAGSSVDFLGGSITVPDNATTEIVLGLWDNQLHAFPRAIDSGMVRIATVVSLNGEITSVKQPPTFTAPHCHIEKTKRKLLAGQPVSIAIIGDSLSEPAGTGTKWTDLLFNATYASNGLNLQNVANITVDNYAVGGQTSQHGMCVALGSAVKNASSGYNITNITSGALVNSKYSTSAPVTLKESPLLTTKYDLVVFGMGANGGTYDLAYQETIIRELRNRGSEMIIHTSTWSVPGGPTSMYDEGATLASYAECNNCAVCDTWSYLKEQDNNGVNTKADTIHLNQAGHTAWAIGMRNVFNDLKQSKGSEPVYSRRASISAVNYIKSRFPNKVDVQFTPSSTTGTVKGSGVVTLPKNPALAYGGKTTSNDCVELTTGQTATFGHQGATHIALLVNQNASFTADVKVTNNTVAFGAVSWTGLGYNKIGLLEVMDTGLANPLPITSYVDVTSGVVPLTNRAITITCTSGTMQLIGVAFFTYKWQELSFKDIEFVGTWASEACWSQTTYYSDTDADSFSFTFEGSGCEMLFNGKSTSGKIDVYLDGALVKSGVNIANAGDYKICVDVFANTVVDDFTTGYGKHIVKVVANGTTGGTTYSAGNHRTQLFSVRVFDTR